MKHSSLRIVCTLVSFGTQFCTVSCVGSALPGVKRENRRFSFWREVESRCISDKRQFDTWQKAAENL